MSWNPVLNLVEEIKLDYKNKFGKIDTYSLEAWIKGLNNEKYNDIFKFLKITQKDNVVLIRYDLTDMKGNIWEDKDSIYRECRSVVIDLEEEKLILTPFRKFFNLNEVEENKIENVEKEIENAKLFEITDKLDGSMQSARYYKDEIFMAGSQSIDRNYSWRLADGYSKLTENHKRMIKENPSLTFIFEYISMRDAHVVKYEESEEGLYLIGIRDTTNGEQFSYKELKRVSDEYKVPMATVEEHTLPEIIELSKNLKADAKEGWILNIDGHLIKIKCDDYVHLHRLLDKVSSTNVVIENVAEDRMDDLLSKIPDTHKARIIEVADKLYDYKKLMEKRVNEKYELAPKDSKKEFMIWVEKNCDIDIKGYVRSKYLGREYNVLKKMNGSYKKASELEIDTEKE